MTEDWADDPLLEGQPAAPSRFWLGFLCGTATAIATGFAVLACIGVLVAIDEEGDHFADEVLQGDAIPDRVQGFLYENGLISEGEQVLYFYSSGDWFQQDGNALTDRGVVSYWDDELTGQRGDYGDVVSIAVLWSTDPEEWLTDVWVTLADETEIELWLDAEDGLDRQFVGELERRCREAPGSVFEGLEVVEDEDDPQEEPAMEDR